MKKLRGAVVGVGYLGRFHAQKYAALGDLVEFVGVCDSRTETAQAVAKELHTQAFSHPLDLIGRVDVVTIATTPSTHFEVAAKLIEAGIHTLVEKPLAATYEQAQRLVSLARQKGVVLQVGHIERFNPAFIALNKKVKAPVYFEANRLAPFKPRALDVDVVTDLMIHDIDLMMTVMKDEVVGVKAAGTHVMTHTFDVASAHFLFKSGRKANINVNRCYPHAVRTVSVYEDRLHHFADLGQLQLTQIERRIDNIYDTTAPNQNQEVVEKHDAMLVETRLFLESVMGKHTPPVTGEDGLRAIHLMESVLNELKR